MRRFLCLMLALLLFSGAALAQSAPEPTPQSANPVKSQEPLHYVILGQDAYTPSSFAFSRTDTVLLVSLDPANQRIVLTSILRDCQVTTPKGAENKINSVYRNHGFEGIKSTVEQHLGIEVQGTVVIDFTTVKKLIDAMGGVEIEIDINEYSMIKSILLNDDPNMPKGPGLTHMTGRIALAYMRDRSSGDGDFSRAERQRKVIEELIRTGKTLSLPQLLEVYNIVVDGLATDLSAQQLLSAVTTGFPLMQSEVLQNHIPQQRQYSYGTLRGSSVLVVRWDRVRDSFNALMYPRGSGSGIDDRK